MQNRVTSILFGVVFTLLQGPVSPVLAQSREQHVALTISSIEADSATTFPSAATASPDILFADAYRNVSVAAFGGPEEVRNELSSLLPEQGEGLGPADCDGIRSFLKDQNGIAAQVQSILALNYALCLTFRGDGNEAATYLQQVSIRQREDWAALSTFVLGRALFETDRYTEASAAFVSSQNLASKLEGFESLRAEALAMLSFAKAVMGNIDEALATNQLARELSRNLGSDRLLGVAYNNLAGIRAVEGRMQLAVPAMESSLEHLKYVVDFEQRVLMYCNLAYVYMRTGEFALAREALHAALTVPTRGVMTTTLALLHQRLGFLYLALGDGPRAASFLTDSIEFYQSVGDDWRGSIALSLLATAIRASGDAVTAKHQHREALQVLLELQQFSGALEAATGLLRDLIQLDEQEGFQEVIRLMNEVLKNGDVTSLRIRAEAVAAMAAAQARMQLPGSALELLETRLGSLKTINYPPAIITLLAERARILDQLGKADAAIAVSREAVRYSETLKAQLEAVRLGPAWTAKTAAVHDWHVDALLRRYESAGDPSDLNEAFRAAEMARFAYLRQRRLELDRISTVDNDPDLLSLRRQLAIASDNWAAKPADKARQIEYEKTYARLEAALPETNHTEGVSLLNLDDVQARLQTDEVMIYFLGGSRLLISRETISLAPKHGQKWASIEAIQNPNPSDHRVVRDLALIGSEIFSTIPHDSSVRRLLIVPDAKTASLPFPALGGGALTNNAPIVEQFEVVLATGASAYLTAPRQDVESSTGPLLTVLADPDFGLIEMHPDPKLSDRRLRQWSRGQSRLVASAREARRLQTRIGSERVDVYVGPRARSNMLNNIETRTSRILHIASHGYVDTSTGLSGIALSDGLVPAGELSALQFRNELVVISACSTAIGPILAGEGAMSISRAFLAQGARATLSTLWPIDDEAAAHFIGLFYDSLADGAAPSAALQTAQNRMRGVARYRHPYYWGGYILTATGRLGPLLYSQSASDQSRTSPAPP